MDMIGSVVHVNSKELVVKDFKTNDNVIVLYSNDVNIIIGDCVRVKYNESSSNEALRTISAYWVWKIECPN